MATFTATPEKQRQLEPRAPSHFVTDSRDPSRPQMPGRWFPCPGCPVFSHVGELHDHWRYGAICKCDGIPSEPCEADLNTGLLTLTYSGQVCTAQN